MHGGFQAYLLGISVVTGNVTSFFDHATGTEFGYLSLWEDGIACSWLQESSEVAARYSLLLQVSYPWSLIFLTSTVYTDFE